MPGLADAMPILESVAKRWGYTVTDMASAKRTGTLINARLEARTELVRRTLLSGREIGELTGVKKIVRSDYKLPVK